MSEVEHHILPQFSPRQASVMAADLRRVPLGALTVNAKLRAEFAHSFRHHDFTECWQTAFAEISTRPIRAIKIVRPEVVRDNMVHANVDVTHNFQRQELVGGVSGCGHPSPRSRARRAEVAGWGFVGTFSHFAVNATRPR